MSERLYFHLTRGTIDAEEFRAGQAWYGDWIECGRPLKASRADLDRATDQGQARRPNDLMIEAARQRLRRAKLSLGGDTAHVFHVLYAVYLVDHEPGDVADQLRIRRKSVLDMLKLGLRTLANGVYRVREAA